MLTVPSPLECWPGPGDPELCRPGTAVAKREVIGSDAPVPADSLNFLP